MTKKAKSVENNGGGNAMAPSFGIDDRVWPVDEEMLQKGGPVCQERMKGVIDYVKANFSNHNLSVGSVADDLGFNASYLSRTFKFVTCIGLGAYIQFVRVSAAKELLKDSSVSVKSVADRVGFNSVLTMNRAFHRLESMTAGQVRKKL